MHMLVNRWSATNLTKIHQRSMHIFMVVVCAHWAEHAVQAAQIYLLDWPRQQALGLPGFFYPQLISSELLHYAYAAIMLLGIAGLLVGFGGVARKWWLIALALQFWHHVEHGLLLYQAGTGVYLFGASYPTSVLQFIVPRVELHLFYNIMVMIPMLCAMVAQGRHIKARETTTQVV